MEEEELETRKIHILRHLKKRLQSDLKQENSLWEVSSRQQINGTFLNWSTMEPTHFLMTSTAIQNDSIHGNSSTNGTNPKTTDEDFEWRTNMYLIIIPVMLTVCLITIVLNTAIVISMKWVRRSISATLCFNVSLAFADAYASLFIGIGLVINSLLPYGFGIHVKDVCFLIVLEAFRLAGPIISVLHLLALAINHYLGIVRPLHYASIVTKRVALILIAFMWFIPCLFILVYFSNVPDQGFQSKNCTDYRFLTENVFRVLYSCILLVPLTPMTFIYTHIFTIVKRHQMGLSKFSSDPSLKRNIKATVTTLLILGTYILGWVPAVLFYSLVCNDCLIHYSELQRDHILAFSIIGNCLVLLKSFLDPLIYAARTREIKEALKRIRRLYCLCNDDYGGERMNSRNHTMSFFSTSIRNGKRNNSISRFSSQKSSTYV